MFIKEFTILTSLIIPSYLLFNDSIENNDCTQTRGWNIEYTKYLGSTVRTGIKKTKKEPVLGNILYLQGLGDSMMNHEPLFKKLNEEGFNIISFDYRGQGCSSGSMNNSTINNINKLARSVWQRYNTTNEKIKIIGWSTGGLAAYKMAYDYPNEVSAVALIAPGISPRYWIGDNMEITEKTLTNKTFVGREENPHVDSIRPKTPLKTPKFALNLQYTANKSRSWKMPSTIAGHVFLSSQKDRYVDSERVREVIEENASQFRVTEFEQYDALHELDNEIDEVSIPLHDQLVDFMIYNQ